MSTMQMHHPHSQHHHEDRHRFWAMPETSQGRLAARVFAVGFVSFVIFTVIVTFADLPISEGTGAVIGLSTLALIGLVIAASLPLTLRAIIRYGERSIFNFLIILPSTVAIFFAIGEMFFPH